MRVVEGVELAPRIGDLEKEHDVRIAHDLAPPVVVAEVMVGREVHAAAEAHYRRLQAFRELHEELHAFLVARHAIGDDHRALGTDQPLRCLGEGGAIALRRARARELRDAKASLVDRLFLKVDVGHHQHRLARRRHGDLERAMRRLGEMLQRHRIVVPLHVVAHDERRVLHRMVPLGARPTLGRVEPVAGEHHDRHAITPGVVDAHRGMLQADGAMHQHAHRLARRLGVAVRHRHRRFLVQAGEELRLLVATVVDQRLVQAAKARARIGRHVVEVERLDDVDHEIGARTLDHDVARQLLLFVGRGLGRLGGLRRHGRSGAGGGSLQEIAALHVFSSSRGVRGIF